MNRVLMIALGVALCASNATHAQTPPPSGQKSLAATINVYVFPTQGQPPDTQSKDEAACYQWAVQNTGTDPFQAAKQAEQQKQQAQQQAAQASQGSGAKGAARGAAGGALIGAIAGDAGTGAAVGAATGAVAGRSRSRRAQAGAEEQAKAVDQATAQQIGNFKKAFSVCLEGKKYMVKY